MIKPEPKNLSGSQCCFQTHNAGYLCKNNPESKTKAGCF